MKRIQIIIFILVVGIVYFLTLPKGIGFGDAGTMAAAAVTLGVPHPPGFPTYLMLGHLFSLLPFGSTLWRLQLVSLLPAIALVALMPTLFSSLLLAFFYGFWSQVGNVESFLLTNLFIFGLTWLSLSGAPTLLIGLLLGLGAGLNPIAVVVVPVLLYIYKFSKKSLAIFSLATLTAILVYTYLPLRAATHPFLNWGNPATPSSLLKYLQGSGLSVSTTSVVNGFTGSFTWLASAWARFGYLAWVQLTPFVICLALYGAWILWNKERQRFWIWIMLIFGNVTLAGLYVSGNRDLWLLTSLIVLVILAGVGLTRLGKLSWLITAIALSLILAISAPKIYHRAHSDISSEYLRDLYANLPPNAILLGGGETFNALTLYAHEVAKIRPDVTPIDMTIYYGQAWYQENLGLPPVQATFADELEFSRMLENFASQFSSRPVYVTSSLLTEPIYANSRRPAYIPQTLHLVQNGLVYHFVDQGVSPIPLSSSPIWETGNYLESNYQKAEGLLRQEYAFSYEQTGDVSHDFLWYTKAYQIAPQYFDQNKLSEKIIQTPPH